MWLQAESQIMKWNHRVYRTTAWSCKRPGVWNTEAYLDGLAFDLSHSDGKIANRGVMCKVKSVL